MGLTREAKVGNLDAVDRRCCGRGGEGRVPSHGRVDVGRRGAGHHDVLWLDVAVEEVVGVDVFEAGEDLDEDALDAGAVKDLVITLLHELIQVDVHVLHADV